MNRQTKAVPPIVEVEGVHCYIGEDGTAYIRIEDAARGLGFVQVKNGVEYIRWDRINAYLAEFSPHVGNFPNKLGKGDYIPEQVFYLLAMKANNEAARNFQFKVAFKILPSIRKHGYYSVAPVVVAPAPVVALPEYRIYLFLLSDGTVKIGFSKRFCSRIGEVKREINRRRKADGKEKLTFKDVYFTPKMTCEDARLVEHCFKEIYSDEHIEDEIFAVAFKKARARLNTS